MQELKGTRSWTLWLALIYYAILLGMIVQADHPLNLFYLNEVFMLPFIVLLTTLFFQRELAGTFPEMLVTYPISITAMIARKFLIIFGWTVLFHLGWSMVYLLKFGEMITDIYPFSGGNSSEMEVSWFRLFIQSMPEYWLFICLSIAGIVISKRLYGGIIIAFAYWLFELISMGIVTKAFTLFTLYLQGYDGSFLMNRLVFTLIAAALLILAIITFNHRFRWIVDEEPE